MKLIKRKFLMGALLLLTSLASAQKLEIEIKKELNQYTMDLVKEFDNISEDRRSDLVAVGDFLIGQLNANEDSTFKVLFVCTHNSRRSHFADTWFKYAMVYYGLSQFESYSGGLEATAFNPQATSALERAGFIVHYNKEVENPVVSITPGRYPVWRMKSKVYTHEVNPKSNFAAIMVCSDADKSCPMVQGASARFSLPYNDPRYYDGTPSQDLKYDQTVREIGREMFFLVDYMKTQLITRVEVSKR